MWREVNRKGVEMEIHSMDGAERIEVTNWPGGLLAYTDRGTKRLSWEFAPEVVRSTVGRALPEEHREVERIVLPVVAMSLSMGEFVGFDERNLPKTVECQNYFLERAGLDFRTAYDPALLAEAVGAGYLREEGIDHRPVYLPTYKGVRPMCDTRGEVLDYVFGLHSGIQMNPGHRRLPDWAGD